MRVPYRILLITFYTIIMSLLTGKPDLDEDLEPRNVLTFSIPTPPRINIFQRIDIALRSSQLEGIFRNKYWDIMDGRDLNEVIASEYARNYFSEWFCNQNLPFVLKLLISFTPEKARKLHTKRFLDVQETELLRNLMEGRAIISKSKLTEVLKATALAVAEEYGISFEQAYRICFTLILTHEQKRRHLYLGNSINVDDHLRLVETTRNYLIERIIVLEH